MTSRSADAVHSEMRTLVSAELPKPRFTAHAWRTVVDQPDDFGSIFREGTIYHVLRTAQ